MMNYDNKVIGEIVPPNAEMLAITRLYLEKYEQLAEPDRALYRHILETLTAPTFIPVDVKSQIP